MKTTIEVKGFEITIDETETALTVTATKEGETVEEFELSLSEEGSEDLDMGDEDEVQDFEDEEDLDSEDLEDSEEDLDSSDDVEESDDEESEDDEVKLESFQSFINKKKK